MGASAWGVGRGEWKRKYLWFPQIKWIRTGLPHSSVRPEFDWHCSNVRLSAVITGLCEENSTLCLPCWWGPGSRAQPWLIMTGFCPSGAVGDLTCPFVCHQNRDPIQGPFPRLGNVEMTDKDKAKTRGLLWCYNTCGVVITIVFC